MKIFKHKKRDPVGSLLTALFVYYDKRDPQGRLPELLLLLEDDKEPTTGAVSSFKYPAVIKVVIAFS